MSNISRVQVNNLLASYRSTELCLCKWWIVATTNATDVEVVVSSRVEVTKTNRQGVVERHQNQGSKLTFGQFYVWQVVFECLILINEWYAPFYEYRVSSLKRSHRCHRSRASSQCAEVNTVTPAWLTVVMSFAITNGAYIYIVVGRSIQSKEFDWILISWMCSHCTWEVSNLSFAKDNIIWTEVVNIRVIPANNSFACTVTNKFIAQAINCRTSLRIITEWELNIGQYRTRRWRCRRHVSGCINRYSSFTGSCSKHLAGNRSSIEIWIF